MSDGAPRPHGSTGAVHVTTLRTPSAYPRDMAGPPPAEPETILLVDGENIDATLGGSLLGRRPAPEERPRWDRVREHTYAIDGSELRAIDVWNRPER